jgi:hypothetical protein
MRERFAGKVAMVTGGNSGIGLATARAFASEGARIVVTGRNAGSLKAAQEQLGRDALVLQADVSRVSEIAGAMKRVNEEMGRIDALFVNAGIGKFVPFAEVTEELYDETMAINVKGAFFTVQRAIPLFSKGAAVVLNASINAHMGMANTTVYGPSKAAVVNMAKTMSADLLPLGVRVNVVSPGPVRTAIISRMGLSEEEERKTKEWIAEQVPLHRFAEPEEIAAAVLYLCSDEARFVVGTELVIDGGMIQL